MMQGIRTTLHNRGSGKAPFLVAVFLFIIVAVAGAKTAGLAEGSAGAAGVPAGRALADESRAPLASLLTAGTPLFPRVGLSAAPSPLQNSALSPAVAATQPVILQAGSQTVTVSYRVKKGDTLQRIASSFGVSAAAIRALNPGASNRQLKRGQMLTIALAVEAPPSGPVALSGGQAANDAPAHFSMTRAAAAAYFGMPTRQGFNWGKLHPENAVDIADVCGTPVLAAAAGIVTPDPDHPDNANDWNEGYGHFVLLDHQDGTETRYAHLDQILVSVGDVVKRGQEVGTMGETGDATGCHVHFEVLGAPNPFAK